MLPPTLNLIFLNVFVLVLVTGKQGFGPGDQDWGYVEVRPKGHMFWWLHYTTASPSYTDRPLIIWLQGGPGGSASGEGNILMSGLVDQDGHERPHSYVHKANVLYIDSPIGAGYSYLEEGGTFPQNTSDLANDFIALIKGFFVEHPEFEEIPLYILGESFGGKFAPALGQRLHKEVVNGMVKANLKGVGMAYPATQHVNNIYYIPDVLYHGGIIDEPARKEMNNNQVFRILMHCNLGNWTYAWSLMDKLLAEIPETYGISFFRITSNDNNEGTDLESFHKFMDSMVSPALNLTVPFGRQRFLCGEAINDKLIPTTSSVLYLLQNTDVKVFVYNGQLDWVVNSIGTYSWVSNLNWENIEKWKKANRKAFYVNGIHEGHERSFGNLAFYWIKRAGHRLPNDNPNAMDYILKQQIGY